MQQALHLSKIILTNDGNPIFNGGLLIEKGIIREVGKKEDFGDLTNRDFEIIDHGNSFICPGFINLHTHLLYSKVQIRNSSEGLFQWLAKLVDSVQDWSDNDYANSIRTGISTAIEAGTTFIVENTPSIMSANEIAKSPLKAIIGLEIFGSDEEKSDEIFEAYLEQINKCHSQLDRESSLTTDIAQSLDSRWSLSSAKAGDGNDRTELTFSPHAAYDVSKPLWEKILEWSKQNNKPILTHLEESTAEKSWWQNKSGEAINFWKKINKLEPKLQYWKKYNSSIDFLNKNKLLSKNLIATHLSQANEEDLKTLKSSRVKLIHCPRSNYFLNSGTANLKLWDELGLLWGIGTDSLASNDSLDLLEELRFTLNQQQVIYNYKLSLKQAFEAITLSGGKILSRKIGCLKEGFEADFLIYNLNNKLEATNLDPYNLIIFNLNNKKDLEEVWINGKKAWIREAILNRI